MSTYLPVLPALLAVLLDVAFAPGATVFGVRPSLTLITVGLWAGLRPQTEVMILATAAGLLLGLLGNEPLGVSLLALAPVVVLGGLLEPERTVERRFLISVGLVVAGTLAYVLILLLLARPFGGTAGVGRATFGVVGGVTLVNATLAAVLYWPLARLSAGEPRAQRRRFM